MQPKSHMKDSEKVHFDYCESSKKKSYWRDFVVSYMLILIRGWVRSSDDVVIYQLSRELSC